MIQFFRKIRQKLLHEGRFKSYVKYAIGEIILIVVGILIALQLNNWNERRKLHNTEIVYLNRLKADLEDQLAYFQREDSLAKARTEVLSEMMDTFRINPNTKGLDFIIKNLKRGFSEMVTERNTYDEMKSTGILYTIDNRELIEEIQEYYNWTDVNKFYIEANNNDIAASWQRPFFKYIYLAWEEHQSNRPYETIDLSAFKEKNSDMQLELRGYLSQLRGAFESKHIIFQDHIKFSKILINMLDAHLESLD